MWTTPMTAVAGTVYTAAQFNTYVRDNLLALRATPQFRCMAYHNTTQSVSANTTAALNLNSEESGYDVSAMHDVSTNNSRVTIPTGGGGTYLVSGSTHVEQTGATALSAILHLYSSGFGGFFVSRRISADSTVLPSTALHLTAQVILAAGQYVELHGEAVDDAVTFGSATARYATRLDVLGPLPPT